MVGYYTSLPCYHEINVNFEKCDVFLTFGFHSSQPFRPVLGFQITTGVGEVPEWCDNAPFDPEGWVSSLNAIITTVIGLSLVTTVNINNNKHTNKNNNHNNYHNNNQNNNDKIIK